jgi:hypothetical protein
VHRAERRGERVDVEGNHDVADEISCSVESYGPCVRARVITDLTFDLDHAVAPLASFHMTSHKLCAPFVRLVRFALTLTVTLTIVLAVIITIPRVCEVGCSSTQVVAVCLVFVGVDAHLRLRLGFIGCGLTVTNI